MSTEPCGPEFKLKLTPPLGSLPPPQPTRFKSKSTKRAVKCHKSPGPLGTTHSPAFEPVSGSEGPALQTFLFSVCFGKGQFIPQATWVKSRVCGRIKGGPLRTVWFLINDAQLSQALLSATRVFSQHHTTVL